MLEKLVQKLPIKGAKLPDKWVDYGVGDGQLLVIETQEGPTRHEVRTPRELLKLKRSTLAKRTVRKIFVQDIVQ